MAAVEMTNGRLMDGFRIRTFLDKGAAVESRSLKNSKVANFRSEKMKSRQAGHDKGIDERLYKVVLMLNKGNGKSVEVPVEPVKGSTVGLEASEAMQIVTLEKDSECRLGRVIRVDTETLERLRLDKARLLLGVRCLSRIPPQIRVEMNGETFFLKVSCSAYEDDHCWIDGRKTNSAHGKSPSSDHGSLGRSWMGLEPVEVSEILGKGNKLIVDNRFDGSRGTPSTRASLGDSKEQKVGVLSSSDRPNENQLFEVQIEGGAESNSSSGHNISIEPILDPVSGMYSIRPRLVTRLKSNNVMDFCSRLMNRPNRGGFSPVKVRDSDKSQGAETREGRPEKSKGIVVSEELPRKGENFLAEAKVALELCENLGLIFNEEREVIFNRKESCSKECDYSIQSQSDVIQESKLKLVNSRIVDQMCGTSNKYKFSFVAPEGSAGGLISLWDPEFFKCEHCLRSKSYIILQGERFQMFDELIKCINGLHVPVIIGGDFNITKSKEEKIGVCFHRRAMREFSEFIETLSLVNIPLMGGWFTWSNFRDVPSFSRLDRFLISTEVLLLWPDLFQCVHPKSISDHNPVSMSLINSSWGLRPFKWFNYLADDMNYVKRVENVCLDRRGVGICSILESCKKVSKDWVLNHAGESKVRIKEVEGQCELLEQKLIDGNADLTTVTVLKENRAKLWALIRREEQEWIQKSRLNWAVEGDRNTKFFHLVASARRRSNYIGSI
ncbi:hypothetical protein V6N13_063931 [Hibiscus sabdariffa]